MKKVLILTAIFLILTSAWTIAQVVVLQGNGAEFTQVDYPYDIPRLDSETGFLKVDLPDLRLSTGMNSGFLNAELNGGWVVRNLPVFTASEYPYSKISTGFNLGSTAGTNVTSFNIDLQFSHNPIDSFVSATPTAFSVGDTTIYTSGMEYDPVTGDGAGAPPAAAAPVDLAKVTADLLNGKSNSKIQFGHPNIEAAQSQCAPMAVANSLQFLEDTTNLVIPHDHKQGIKGEATPSLVGELGTYMERVVPTTDRRNNAAGGVKTENILKGKLKYLLNNNLSDKVETVYWSGFSNADVSETVGSVTATATYMGKLVSIANMLDYLRNDCDLEAAYYWNYTNAAGVLKKGAHAIEITGTG
ncbi:MAG: hypothetical protein KAR45_04095, partial [Desulfobacteraceae bacterium]|nr:hypothetical protein [Desulfobacteraceae bacterium]